MPALPSAASAFAARLCRLADDVVDATTMATKDAETIGKWEREKRSFSANKANRTAEDSFSSFLVYYDGLRASNTNDPLALEDFEAQSLPEAVWSIALPSIFKALQAQDLRATPATVVHLLSPPSIQVSSASTSVSQGSSFHLEWLSGGSLWLQLSADFFTPPEQHQIALGFVAQTRTPAPRGHRFFPTSLEVCLLTMFAQALSREVANSASPDYGLRPKRLLSMVSDTLKAVSDVLYPSTSSDDPDFESDSDDDGDDLPPSLPLRPLLSSVIHSSDALLSLLLSCSEVLGEIHATRIRLFGLLSRSVGRDVCASFSPIRPAFDGLGGVPFLEGQIAKSLIDLELDCVLNHPRRAAYRKRTKKTGEDDEDDGSDGSHYASSDEEEEEDEEDEDEEDDDDSTESVTGAAGRLSTLPFTSAPRWCPVGVAAVAYHVFMSRKNESGGCFWFPSVLTPAATWSRFWPHVPELLLAGESFAAAPSTSTTTSLPSLPPATEMGLSLASELLSFVPSVPPSVSPTTPELLGSCQLLLNAAARHRSTKAIDIVRELVKKVESEDHKVSLLTALLRTCPNDSLLPVLLNIAHKAAISDDQKLAFCVPHVEDMLSCRFNKKGEIDDSRLVNQREIFVEAVVGAFRGGGPSTPHHMVERLNELYPTLLARCRDFAKDISASSEWQLGLLQHALSELPPS